MEPNIYDAARLHELQEQLEAVQAKLQKSETAKKKLREHLALLKEKAINSLALVEEQVALQKDHTDLQQQHSHLQQELQQALGKSTAAVAARKATEQQYHAALRDKQKTEKQLEAAQKAADRARQAQQAAMHERDQALAGMAAMQQQLNQLNQAVKQLQQQRLHPGQQQQLQQLQQLPGTAEAEPQQQQVLVHRLRQLEAQMRDLQEMEVEVDVQDLFYDLQQSTVKSLTSKIDSKLHGLQEALTQLQRQQRQVPTVQQPGALVTAACTSAEERGVSQLDFQQLHQQMKVLAAQQQRCQALLAQVLQAGHTATTAAAARGVHALDQGDSCNFLAGAASAAPTREQSPAVGQPLLHRGVAAAAAATAQQLSGAAAAATSSAAAAATEFAGRLSRNQQQSTAAAAAGTASMGGRGSSMFGTTAVMGGGTSNSYDVGQETVDMVLQAGSPSVGNAPQQHVLQQNLQQQPGHKRQREEHEQQQQQSEGTESGANSSEFDPWDAFAEQESSMQLQLPPELPPQQQQQQRENQQQCASAVQPPSSSSPIDKAPAADTDQPSAKRSRVDNTVATAVQQATTASTAGVQQVQQVATARTDPDLACKPEAVAAAHVSQQRSSVHQKTLDCLRGLQNKQNTAATVAQQLASAVLAGGVEGQDVLDAFCECFLANVASVYDAQHLQCALAEAKSGNMQHILCNAGWTLLNSNTDAATAQRQVAACAAELSHLLIQQQLQQQQIGSSSVSSAVKPGHRQQQQLCRHQQQDSTWQYNWPAAAAASSLLFDQPGSVKGCSCSISCQCGTRKQLEFAQNLACRMTAQVTETVKQLGAAVLVPPAHQQLQQLTPQQHQQQVLKPPDIPKACAASAAAAQLYKAAGDRRGFLQLIVRLLSIAAAYDWSRNAINSSTGGSTTRQQTDQQQVSTASADTAPASGCLNADRVHHVDSGMAAAFAPCQQSAAVAVIQDQADTAAVDRCRMSTHCVNQRLDSSVLGAAGVTAAAARECSRLGFACLLAAVAVWPEALQYDTAAAAAVCQEAGVPPLIDMVAVTRPCKLCSDSGCNNSSAGCGSCSCWLWQWAVLDPLLLSIRCCLQQLTSGEAAAVQHLVAAAVGGDRISSTGCCNSYGNHQLMAGALQLLLLNRLPVNSSVRTCSSAPDSMAAATAADGCASGAGTYKVPPPDVLLSSLLGMLQWLLQKPHAEEVSECSARGSEVGSAVCASLCDAASLVMLFVPRDQANAMLLEIKSSGDVCKWPSRVQRLLANVGRVTDA